MTREIFISYSRKDLEKVKTIKEEIEKATGAECWMDLEDIYADEEDYLDRIVEGIENCRIFVFMLSESSQASKHAIGELVAANKQKEKNDIHVVIANIDNCEMSMKLIIRLAAKNTIVWSEKTQKDNLFRCIKKWLGETTSRGEGQNEHKEDEIINLFPIEIEGEYGYADEFGKVVIPCQWLYAEDFSEGLARIHKWYSNEDNHQGFIDKTGDTIIPCQWKFAKPFSEGLAAVMNDNDMWGFINKKGHVIIPCNWNGAQSFHDGLAVIKDINRSCGFIDKRGDLVIPCQWRDATSFKDGFAKVEDENRRWWIIDKTGKIIGETTR